MRRRADSNRRIKVLQTSPLPLGYGAAISSQIKNPTAWWDGRRGSIFVFEEVHSFLSIQDVVNAHCYFPVGRAGNGTRTRDINLGKVALYQLSYSRESLRPSDDSPLENTKGTGSFKYKKIPI
jgi:hypothetical protein